MAEELNIPLRTYQNHEAGASAPKAAQLKRLAALGCDILWLITGYRQQDALKAEGALETGLSETGGPEMGGPEMGGPEMGGPNRSRASLPDLIDERAYRLLYFEISRIYEEETVKIDAANMSLLVSRKYQEIAAVADGANDWPGAIKVILAQIRRSLHQAIEASSSGQRV